MDIKFKVQGDQASMESLDRSHRAILRTADLINTVTWLQKSIIKNDKEQINDWINYIENDVKFLRDIINER